MCAFAARARPGAGLPSSRHGDATGFCPNIPLPHRPSPLFVHHLPMRAWASVALAGCVLSASLHAQTPAQADPGLALRESTQLAQTLDTALRGKLPSFISGLWITGRPDLEVLVEGEAQLRRGDLVVHADRLQYDQLRDLASASGAVRVNRAGNVYEGPQLQLQVDAFEGRFEQPSYRLLRQGAHGQAQQVDFIDADRSVIHAGTYTTCPRRGGPDWMPDWVLSAQHIALDSAEQSGVAREAVLRFKGVPVLATPYLDFALDDARRSGLLPPTVAVDNVSGLQWTQPWYWNIAPNRDATFTPTLLARRGLQLGGEFRYLEADYQGALGLDWLGADPLRQADRWALHTQHQGRVGSDWVRGGLGLSVALNRVSDDDYWRDFNQSSVGTQRLLANDASLSWSAAPWTLSARVQRWQTLQDSASPITPPYDRLPQLHLSHTSRWAGHDLRLEADYTRFASDASRTAQANAERTLARAVWSHPWRNAWGAISPRLQLHATHYVFDRPLADGSLQASRVLPTFSLDAALLAERDWRLGGRDWLQTLEPRLFYVHTPWRDQSLLPNYDAGANDFNLSTVFTDQAFVGDDRIADTHAITLGLSSRLIDPASGAEALRLGVAQRFRLAEQRVTLPGGLPETDRASDVLLGAALGGFSTWGAEGTLQFKPTSSQWERASVSASYHPGPYRSVSLAYRYQRASSEQIDLGWQWPLPVATGARWFAVGRLNYSVYDARLVDGLLGLEYDGGCWIGRVMLEQLQTGTDLARQRLVAQLEFVGLSRLGTSPTRSLADNIPGYRPLRGPVETPSRFNQYD